MKGIGLLQGKLFELQCVAVCEERAAVASDGPNEMDLWHQRLAHVCPQLLTRIVKDGLIRGVKVAKSQAQSFCEGCVKGKMSRKPCKSTGGIHSTRKLQLVHNDVCGPMQTESIGGKRYFVSFTDDYSRCAAVYFMRSKAEVLDKFKEFQGIPTNDSGNPIGTLRSDNGGEYMSREFREYLKQKGIRHETSVPHTPEQNGVAERLNRTLCEKARSMIAHAGLPKMYWAEAIATAAYLKNRLPTRALNGDVTPYELWYERKADLSHTRVFGCIAYAMTPDMQRRKLDDKAVRLRFVGYDRTTKGYRLIDEDTRKVYKRRDVAFNEYDFGHRMVPETAKDTVPLESEKTDDASPPVDAEAAGRPQRIRRPVKRYMIDEFADVMAESEIDHVAMKAGQILEPTNLEVALSNNEAQPWKGAANAEVKSLMENKTRKLFELPPEQKPIGYKWMSRTKHGTGQSGPVSWHSKKQATVAMSTTEAEYIALSSVIQEAVWLRRLLHDVGVKETGPTMIAEDNQGTIALTKNPVSHSRTKHIDMRHHYICEAVGENIIAVEYCPTKEILADILTKLLPRITIENLCEKMGLNIV